jgi:ABC-type bacteriocin/lantibiotic exporter with double-glycine peptidase domain
MKGVGFQLTSLIFIPIQIIIAIYLMYSFIGISFLSGLLVMISSMLFTYFLMKIQAKLNSKLLKAKDARMKVTEEILSAIRFIKVNAYEKYFFNKLNKKRN